MQSDQIDKIMPALLKAQSEMGGAVKKADNPFFKSKYADLATVQAVCEKPLFDNGLVITQVGGMSHYGNYIYTQITHTSGQWVRSEIALPTITKAQDMGSCITYYRRYGLAALLNITQEDDDGNAASRSRAEEAAADPRENGQRPDAQSTQKAGKKRSDEIGRLIKAGFLEKKVVKDSLALCKAPTVSDLPKDEADMLINRGLDKEIQSKEGA